jgi:hypothetical protein
LSGYIRRKEHIKQRNLDSKRLLQRNRNVQTVLESKQNFESTRLFDNIKKALQQNAVTSTSSSAANLQLASGAASGSSRGMRESRGDRQDREEKGDRRSPGDDNPATNYQPSYPSHAQYNAQANYDSRQMMDTSDMDGMDGAYGYQNLNPDVDFEDAQFLKGNGPTFDEMNINEA